MNDALATRAEGASDNKNTVGPLTAAETIKLARELKEKS